MSPMARTVLAAVGALTLAACGEQIGGPDGSAASDSVTTFLLTDGPFPYDEVARVDVYIESVAVSITADTGTIRDSSGAEFITAAEPHRQVNLLDLQHGTVDTLGVTRLPAGDYRSLRLVINADSSSITLKDARVLTRTSSPGIDWQILPDSSLVTMWALVFEPLGVPDTGGTIVIDFDVGRNFAPLHPESDPTGTNEGFISFNFVRAVKLERSGTVTGRAVGEDGAGVPDASVTAFLPFDPTLPENTWSLVATAPTDASGDFTISYLTPTDWFPTLRRYVIGVDVRADTGFANARYFDVSLAAGEVRDIGTLIVRRP
jgi:hypothetical protein